MDFARPLLDPLIETEPEGATPENLERVLMIAVTVWNAVVLSDLGVDRVSLGRARDALVSSPQTPASLVQCFDELVERKRTRFRNDDRLIGKYDVVAAGDGEFRVIAEARGIR